MPERRRTDGNVGDQLPVAQRQGAVLSQVAPRLQHRHARVAAHVPAVQRRASEHTRACEAYRDDVDLMRMHSNMSATVAAIQHNSGANNTQVHAQRAGVPDALLQHVQQQLLGAQAGLRALGVCRLHHRVAATAHMR